MTLPVEIHGTDTYFFSEEFARKTPIEPGYMFVRNSVPDASGKVDVFNMGLAKSIELFLYFGTRITAQTNEVEKDAVALGRITKMLEPAYNWPNNYSDAVANEDILRAAGVDVTRYQGKVLINGGPLSLSYPPVQLPVNTYEKGTMYSGQYADGRPLRVYYVGPGEPLQIINTYTPYVGVRPPLAAFEAKVKTYASDLTQGAQGKQAFLQDLILNRDRYLNAATNIDERGASVKRAIIDAFKA